jgi:NADPH2:quinone reductase
MNALIRQVPEDMMVVEITAAGGPEQLNLTRRPTPRPGRGEVLVRVVAAGVNGLDILQRRGLYPPPPGGSDIPGLEVAGEVVACGNDVLSLEIGDQVAALLSGGGYAAYAVAAAPLCLPIPAGLSVVEAAALPETYFTVWNNLFERSDLNAGDTVLVHGGTGGIGTTAIQLATVRGARVFATAGSAEKARACERLGAVRGIDYRNEDFVQVVRQATDGKGVDLILDIIGASYFERNLAATAPGGRLVVISLIGGNHTEINLNTVMRKCLTLTGSTLRSRSVAEKAMIADAVRRNVWPLIAAGRVRPPIYTTFPLDRACEAHRLMESSQHIGKIVLTI